MKNIEDMKIKDIPLWVIKNYYLGKLGERRTEILYSEMTIKELLNYGFNNNYLEIDNKIYSLGWLELDNTFSYNLTDKQLNVKVKGIFKEYDDDYLDEDNYDIMYVKCANKEDEELFKGGEFYERSNFR